MASSLAAGKAGGTKTAFPISLLPATAFLEVCASQGLSSEVQSENKTSLRVTQLCVWSWPDPGTSHRETLMSHRNALSPGDNVTFKGICFTLELAWIPLPSLISQGPSKLIAPSHTYLDFSFWGKKYPNQTTFEGDIPVWGHWLGVSLALVLLVVLWRNGCSFLPLCCVPQNFSIG